MSGIPYAERVAQEQRRLILEALEQDTDYTASDTMLQIWLDQFSLALSMDKLRTELAWLSEQGLLEIELSGMMHIAKLTGRGLDVASGRATNPGIARKRPD